MGLRFRKSVKLCKGVRVNFGKTGASLSVGTKGARYTMHSSGRRTASVGVPGTGLSYTKSSGGGSRKNKAKKQDQATPAQNSQVDSKKKTPIWKIILGILFFPIALTIIIAKNKKMKPVLKIVLIALLWIFVLVFAASNANDTPPSGSADNIIEPPVGTDDGTSVSPSDPTQGNENPGTEKDKFSNLNLFIDKYNEIAITPITDTFEIDISAGSEYYRTEFRLNAYQNAPALKGSIGSGSIEMINSNYEGIFGSDLRIYAFVDSLDVVTDIFETYCKVCDPEITKEDFDEFYKYYQLDSGDCRIVIGDISGYVMVEDGGFDILLDSTPDYFDQ